MRVSEPAWIIATGAWCTLIVVLAVASFVLASKPDYQLAALALLINSICMTLLSPILYRMVRVERTSGERTPGEPW
jgi:hypothetical protein